MKRRLPLLIIIAAAVAVAGSLLPERNSGDFDLVGFGRLPVLADGRLKPVDTVARTAILMLQDRQRVELPGGRTITPDEWLLDVWYQPELSDAYRVIRIDNADVLSLFNLKPDDGDGKVRFSLLQLSPGLDELDRQAKLADPVDASARTAFQRAILELRDRVDIYARLKFTLAAADLAEFAQELGDPGRVAKDRRGLGDAGHLRQLRPIPPPRTARRPAGGPPA